MNGSKIWLVWFFGSPRSRAWDKDLSVGSSHSGLLSQSCGPCAESRGIDRDKLYKCNAHCCLGVVQPRSTHSPLAQASCMSKPQVSRIGLTSAFKESVVNKQRNLPNSHAGCTVGRYPGRAGVSLT